MLESAKNILEKAKLNKYAIPQFNINNLEWTKYILEECEKHKSPVILGVSEGAVKYMGGYNVVAELVKALIKDLNVSIPVVLHLDHASSFENCKKAIDSGFTSVMIDASKYDLDKNIEITKEVVSYSLPRNISVEAEVGHIGGTEDDVSADIAYAKVDDCIKLINETKIDFLAPALGSVHGPYNGEPKLDFLRMNEIKEKSNLPLVLHGGSGIPDEMIRTAIKSGIAKLNINTELQMAWHEAVIEFIKNKPEMYDPRKVIGAGESNIKKAVYEKLLLLGSIGKA